MKTKRLFKSITAMILAFALALAPVGDIPILRELSMTANAVTSDSGSCGSGVTYSFSNGTMTISGTGAMTDFSSESAQPWASYRGQITEVVIGSGINFIGDRSFSGCSVLKSVTINCDAAWIGIDAFRDCEKLTEVTITNPNGCSNNAGKSVSTGAFYASGNPALTVYFGGTEAEWNTLKSKTANANDRFIKATVKYKCTITLVADNGTGTTSTAEQFNGKKYTLPACTFAKPSGKKFKCWKVGSTNYNPGDEIAITGTTTVTAVWVDDEYTISFNANGGSTTPANQKTSGKKLTTLPSAGTKTGYNFDGWYTAASGGTQVTTSYGFTSSITIYAHWTPATYNVTLNTNSGTINAGNVTSYTYGTGATLPTNVTRTGYTFDGWYAASNFSGSKVTSIGTTETGDKTFWAKWNANTYTVTYNYSENGGITATKTTATVAYGSSIDLAPTATKDGWTFVGWNTDKDATTGLTTLTMGTANVTLYAIYKKTLTATFYSGSGCGTQTKSVTIYNKATSGNVTAPELTAWSGYTALGWNGAVSGYTKEIAAGASISISADKDYYGVYSKEVTLSYNVGGGTGTVPASQTATRYANVHSAVTYNGGEITLAAGTGLSRQGYTFAGWKTSSAAGATVKQPGDNVQLTESCTYYANWAVHTYTVIYHGNGSTGGSTANSLHTYDAEQALTANGFKREYTVTFKHNYSTVSDKIETAAYRFAGWKDGTGTSSYTDKQSVKNLTAADGGEFNLYAQWTPVSVNYAPTWVGYTFGGWYLESGCSGTRVDSDGTYTPSGDVTLYAKWTINKYTVTFKDHDGRVLKTQENVEYGKGAAAPEDPTRTGYTFSGWDKAFNRITEDTIVTATYTINNHAITFKDSADGTVFSQTEHLNYGETITPPADTKVSKYTFNGWNETVPATMPDEDVTITGTWTRNEITGITFDNYDGTYDREDHSITVTGTVTGDRMEYSADGTNYSDTKPGFKDVGTYTVYCKVIRDDHFDLAGTATVTIRQNVLPLSDVDVEGIGDKTYTGDEITQTLTLKDKNGNVIPASEYNVEYSNNIAAGENTATVTITNKDGGNYKLTGTITGHFTIRKAAITGIEFGGYFGTYDGENHSITVTGTVAGGTVEYSTDGTNYSGTKPEFKEAGTHAVYYKVTKDSNYNDLTGTVTVQINQKEVTISGVTAEDKTYDGSAAAAVTGTPAITGLVSADEGEVSVSVGTAAFADKNVGTDKTVTFTGFTLTGEKADNYHLSAQPASVTASIGKADVAFAWKEEAFTYNGEPQKPGLESVTGIVSGDACSVEVSGEQTNAGGTYTATAGLTGADAGNYILSGETSRDFTIAPKALTVEMIKLDSTDSSYSYTGVAVTPNVTVSDGTAMTASDYKIEGTESATDIGSYDLTVTGMENYTGTVTVTWYIKDATPPTGSITVATNKWNAFLNTITFGLFFKETQTVTITGEDGAGESGVDKLYYYLSGTEFGSESELAQITDWQEVSATGTAEKTGSFRIDPDKKCIIYVKITDKSGNAAYINSDGVILDATAPTIEGVTNEGIYCEAQTVTISDANLDEVTVNGSVVALDEGKYTLAASDTEYTVVAWDMAENNTTVTVTVNNGHTAGEAKEENRVEAACLEDGSYDLAVYCKICGTEMSRETHTIEKTGHSLGEWEEVEAPNCTDKGSQKRSCSACGYTETKDVDAAGHSWESDFTTDKEATCTEEGSRSIHCSNCDVVKDSETIPMIEHTPATDEAKAPTCTETGLTEGSHCAVCNIVLVAQTEIAAAGHEAGEAKEENRREAACLEDGSYDMVVYCKVCFAELSREKHTLGKTGHSLGGWEEVKAPNCTDKGSRKRSCSACGYTETEDVDALGHDHSGSWSRDANGHWKACSRCGTIEQMGSHSYDNAKDTTCNVCEYTRKIKPKKDHSDDDEPSDDGGGQPDDPEGAGDQKQPENGDGQPGSDDRQPESGDKQPGSDDRQPGSDGEQLENDDEQQQDPAERDGETPIIAGEKVITGNVPEAEGAEITLDVGQGKVVVSVICEDEAYTAGVADTVAVANAVLTPEQIQHIYNGENVEIRVDVKDISKDVPVSEKEAVEECIEQQNEIPDLQLGMYIDISIYIRIGSSEWNSVTQTKEPIDVVIGIPEELWGEGRSYYIVRSHEGGITLLYDMDQVEDTITIRTGQFSTYAIAYAQAADTGTAIKTAIGADGLLPGGEDKRCNLCHICPTFLGICCFVWLAVIVSVLAAMVIIRMVSGKRRRRNRATF